MIANLQEAMMIGRTKLGDPVWHMTDGLRPFVIDPKTKVVRRMGLLWRRVYLKRLPKRWLPFRPLPKPHLNYGQVATATELSSIILGALRNGPIFLVKGFLKGRDGRILTTRTISEVVLHWLSGCGVVLLRRELPDGRTEIDVDAEATNANDVR